MRKESNEGTTSLWVATRSTSDWGSHGHLEKNQQQNFGLSTNIMIDGERPTNKIGHFLIGEFAQSKNHILWRQTFIGLGINLPPLALHRWNRFGGAVLILGSPCGHDRQTTSRSYHIADDVYVGRSGIKASYKHWNCERVFRLQERERGRERATSMNRML